MWLHQAQQCPYKIAYPGSKAINQVLEISVYKLAFKQS